MKSNLDAAVRDARALLRKGKIDDAQIPTIVPCTYFGNKGRAKCNVLEDLGLTLHAAQDFYAHTNWVDQPNDARPINASNPPGLNNRGAAPWLNLRTMPSVPDGLISGCFEGIPEADHCNRGGDRVKHAALNKDLGQIDPLIGVGRTDRGQIDDNFKKAVEAAIEDTRDKWITLEERLSATYGVGNSSLMICAITHDDPKRSC